MSEDRTVGYFGGWIDKNKRICILTSKSYPDIEEQEISEETKEELK
jgi:hypothetical protein